MVKMQDTSLRVMMQQLIVVSIQDRQNTIRSKSGEVHYLQVLRLRALWGWLLPQP